MNDMIIGIVENGKFKPMSQGSHPGDELRLTGIQRQESVSPESREIALAEYEGMAMAVQGNADSGWVYSARVIDTGGPLIAALVRQVFG